jgi:hypothetical protein
MLVGVALCCCPTYMHIHVGNKPVSSDYKYLFCVRGPFQGLLTHVATSHAHRNSPSTSDSNHHPRNSLPPHFQCTTHVQLPLKAASPTHTHPHLPATSPAGSRVTLTPSLITITPITPVKQTACFRQRTTGTTATYGSQPSATPPPPNTHSTPKETRGLSWLLLP